MNLRRVSREMALQILFQNEFSESGKAEIALIQNQENYNAMAEDYARRLVNGVMSHRDAIDATIQEKSANWKVSRMALVDRNILRLATFELLFGGGEVPVKTAINEAVEIAKRFGSTDSRSFINGILDEIARSQRTA